MNLISKLPVATAGDADFLYQSRNLTDVYNILVIIAIMLAFWIIWNLIRVLYKICTNGKV